MERVAIVFGLLLCGLTVTGMLISPIKNASEFIPMMFGIPTLLCGVVSLNPHRRRIAMSLATIIISVGALLAGGLAVTIVLGFVSGRDVNLLAFRIVLVMTIACVVFLVAGLVSNLRISRKPRQDSAFKS